MQHDGPYFPVWRTSGAPQLSYSDLVILQVPATWELLHIRSAPASAALLLDAAQDEPQDWAELSTEIFETAKALCFGFCLYCLYIFLHPLFHVCIPASAQAGVKAKSAPSNMQKIARPRRFIIFEPSNCSAKYFRES